MTREQEATLDRMTEHHGQIAVRAGYLDGSVRATAPDGGEFTINEDGEARPCGVNFSVDWSRQ